MKLILGTSLRVWNMLDVISNYLVKFNVLYTLDIVYLSWLITWQFLFSNMNIGLYTIKLPC